MVAMTKKLDPEQEILVRAHAAWMLALSKMPDHVQIVMTTEEAQTALKAAIAVARAEPPPPSVPVDVQKLVIAARLVAYEDKSPDAIKELDAAVEAFADRVPWDHDPNDEGVEP